MDTNPKISIIIPVYNSERYIQACLNSVLCQIYTNYEVIIVDDGSLDDSLSICERYAKEHDQFIFISQSNQGVDVARNNALKRCIGDYIVFLDSDDFVEPEWLQSYVAILSKYPTCDWIVQGLIIDNLFTSNDSIPSTGYYESKDILCAYFELEKHYLSGFLLNKLYKRDLIVEYRLSFKYTLKEDMLFNMKYCSHIKSLAVFSGAYYHYVQRGKQSLIHKRYSPYYMIKLILSLRNAGLELSSVFQNDDYKQFVLEEYLLSYSVVLISMYKKKGIISRRDRFAFIKEYKTERRNYSQIGINIKANSLIKEIISNFFYLVPIYFSDLLFILISPVISKL